MIFKDIYIIKIPTKQNINFYFVVISDRLCWLHNSVLYILRETCHTEDEKFTFQFNIIYKCFTCGR